MSCDKKHLNLGLKIFLFHLDMLIKQGNYSDVNSYLVCWIMSTSTTEDHAETIMCLTYHFDLGLEMTYYQCLQWSCTCHWVKESNDSGLPFQ